MVEVVQPEELIHNLSETDNIKNVHLLVDDDMVDNLLCIPSSIQVSDSGL